MAKFKNVSDYLASLPGVSDVKPVTVTIGRETFSGARYTDTRHYTAGMMAVQRGERKDGEPYTREWLYLLGDLPKPYQRSTRVAFTMADDKREWYVASYHDGRDAPAKPPFTPCFQLAPWEDNKPIDYQETIGGWRKPYRRVAASVA